MGEVRYMIAFTIPGRLPDCNTFYRAQRYNQGKTKRDADELVAWCAKAARIKPIESPVRLHITWYEQNAKRDHDNVSFGIKFVQDGLVKAGILQDDGPRYVKGFSHDFEIDRKNPRIEVEIIIV